jgi:hypothetical protein
MLRSRNCVLTCRSGGRTQDRREETWIFTAPAEYRRLGITTAEYTALWSVVLQEFYQIQLGGRLLVYAVSS